MKKLEILGTGCPKCDRLYERVSQVAAAAGGEFDIAKVTDINAIIGYGVMQTPALVVEGKVVSVGRVPDEDEVRQMITG